MPRLPDAAAGRYLAQTTLRSLQVAGAGFTLALAGCGGGIPVKAVTGYTCCNLHYSDTWISDSNYAELPFIPAGAPAKVTGYGRYRIHLEIDGKAMQYGQDYNRGEPLATLAERIVVATDPRPKIQAAPAAVRHAIEKGRVTPGMTKEQVLVSLGYPLTSHTPSLDAPAWSYWLSSFAQYDLSWDQAGRVKEIVTDEHTRLRVVEQQGK